MTTTTQSNEKTVPPVVLPVDLRDYFAAKAMQGMLADLPKACYGTDWKANVAYEAYALANSMMRARKE